MIFQVTGGLANQLLHFDHSRRQLRELGPTASVQYDITFYSRQSSKILDRRDFELSWLMGSIIPFQSLPPSVKIYWTFRGILRLWYLIGELIFNRKAFYMPLKATWPPFLRIFIEYKFKNIYYLGLWKNRVDPGNLRETIRIAMAHTTTKNYERIAHYVGLYEQFNNCVALCVRRGDFVKIGVAESVSFYNSAIKRFSLLLRGGVVFFVFSDDISYCKEYFNSRDYKFIYVEIRDRVATIEDICLLSFFRYFILDHSSFHNIGALAATKRPTVIGGDKSLINNYVSFY